MIKPAVPLASPVPATPNMCDQYRSAFKKTSLFHSVSSLGGRPTTPLVGPATTRPPPRTDSPPHSLTQLRVCFLAAGRGAQGPVVGDAGPVLPAVLPHHAPVRDRPGRGPRQLRDHPSGEGGFKGWQECTPMHSPCSRPPAAFCLTRRHRHPSPLRRPPRPCLASCRRLRRRRGRAAASATQTRTAKSWDPPRPTAPRARRWWSTS